MKLSTWSILTTVWTGFPSAHFTLADQYQAPLHSEPKLGPQPHKIAIIGAGAGGSSAAYYLNQFSDASTHNIPIDITVFETNDRVGGRTATVNAFNNSRYPVEVGASIFVKVNHILYNATRDFGLSAEAVHYQNTGSKYELGVWDGTSFRFTTANSDDDDDGNNGLTDRWRGWWDIAKLLWKYGISPIRTNSLMKTTVGKFLKLYDENFPFDNLDTATENVDLADFTGVNGKTALSRAGISEQFAQEVVQASTRVNYAQNLVNIHGLETMVCMATDGAMAVEGGNWQIFDRLVERSGAKVHFRTTVTSIQQTKRDTFKIEAKALSSSSSAASSTTLTGIDIDTDKEYDTIILAAPYQFANITFHPKLTTPPEKIDYVSLHVTLFTSPFLPSPSFFGLESQAEIPDTILTTLPVDNNASDIDRGSAAVGPTKFWSISTRVLDTSENESKNGDSKDQNSRQYLYKIFSPEPISADFLVELFDFDSELDSTTSGNTQQSQHAQSVDSEELRRGFNPISSLPSSQITWHHTKHWNSYPYLPPRTKFPPIKLGPNIYYTSAIEPFISTMETSALSGMNIARLIVDSLEGAGGSD